MPAGLNRYQQSDDLHFITFSCHKRLPYLRPAAARDIFVAALERTQAKHRVSVVGYVVMSEHVHLLLSEPPERVLADALHSLKLSVAKRLPQRPFWTSRYHDFNVYRRDKVVEKLRYMHRNPIVRQLCTVPGEWRWSSYCDYLLDGPGPVLVDKSYVFTEPTHRSSPPADIDEVGAPPSQS